MDSVVENCFVVYRRFQHDHSMSPDMVEEPLATCDSYAEARLFLQALHRTNQDGVIRYHGQTGGGD